MFLRINNNFFLFKCYKKIKLYYFDLKYFFSMKIILIFILQPLNHSKIHLKLFLIFKKINNLM
jgi:hypothetical protein